LADLVNEGKVAVNLDNIIIDGQPSEEIGLGGKIYSIRKLITEDLRAIKKKNKDKDGKKQINGKDEQKNILNGRSPDFGDCLSEIIFLDLLKEPEPNVRWL
jgi:hypothetical protein